MGSSFSSSSSSGNAPVSRSTELRRYDQRAAARSNRHDKSDFTSASDLVDHLSPGDLIQSKGTKWYQWFYSHFAVYIGNGDVVHVVGGEDGTKGVVKRERMLDAFAGDVRKNNVMDDTFRPLRVQDIIRIAKSRVEENWKYNFLTNNCEHFASMCRYGKKISLQSLGITDIVNGDITKVVYLKYHVKAVKEKCGTFLSWIKRKAVENNLISHDNPLLSIMRL